MQPATIASVEKSDEARVVATLVSAFIADPVERWLFAEPLQYLTHFARFVAAFGGGGFAGETVFRLGDFAAVAIWIAPGAEPDGDAIVAARGLDGRVKRAWSCGGRHLVGGGGLKGVGG